MLRIDTRQRHIKQNMHNRYRKKVKEKLGIQHIRNIKGSKEVKKIYDTIFYQ
jgi:hypothetical protein